MFIINFGIKQTPININEFMVSCPSCEGHTLADVMVVSNYFHVIFIPFFPVHKEASVSCNSCGLKRHGAAFNSKLIRNYDEVKHEYRHPWFTYIGAAIMIGATAGIIISASV